MKKIKWLLPLFLSGIILCGCNYHELNEIYLVSALSVDYDKEYQLSLLTISDDQDSTTRAIESHGKTIEEAFYHIRTNYNKPLYLGHLNLIIMNENMAKKGIDPLLKIINEDNETKKNFYLILAKDTTAKDVLTYLSSEKLQAKETEGISKYLSLENIHNQVTYNTYTKQMKENNISLLTSYNINEENLITSSLGVLKNGKLKGWIEETDGTLLLNNMLKELVLTVHNHSVVIKNIYVKKKLSGDKITFVLKGKCDSTVSNHREIEQALKKKIIKTIQEATTKNLDYLRLKPFLYNYKKEIHQPLQEIQPDIDIQLD